MTKMVTRYFEQTFVLASPVSGRAGWLLAVPVYGCGITAVADAGRAERLTIDDCKGLVRSLIGLLDCSSPTS
jgi:hypothetical protein